ncbi:MFS general substrate transporter [Penicillium longicatenatum]|nr:MFS general substrate transporter [Penicillium longicatenatum]
MAEDLEMDGPEPAPERHDFEPKRKLTGIKLTRTDKYQDGMYYGLLNLVTVNTLERERPTYLSLTGMVWGLGTVLGPMVGGTFELNSWRWAFYINLLFGAIILPAPVSIIPSNHPVPGVSTRHKLATFDLLGTILSIRGVITLIIPIDFGGNLYAWNSGTIIALFIVSGVLSNGYLMSKFGWYKPWYVCGAIIALVGTVLMSKGIPSIFPYPCTPANADHTSPQSRDFEFRGLWLPGSNWSWCWVVRTGWICCYPGHCGREK